MRFDTTFRYSITKTCSVHVKALEAKEKKLEEKEWK